MACERGQLTISLLELFNQESDLIVQLARVLSPPQRDFLYGWLQSMRIGSPLVFEPKAFVFRTKTNLFGWNGSVDVGTVIAAMGKVPELVCVKDAEAKAKEVLGGLFSALGEYESEKVMFLDGEFRQTVVGSTIAFVTKGQEAPNPMIVKEIRFRPRTAYGIKK